MRLFIASIKKKIIKSDYLLNFIILNLNFIQLIFFKKKLLNIKVVNLIKRIRIRKNKKENFNFMLINIIIIIF
jgi:hypothetical protein